jgi:hypothetical protein
MAWHFVNEAARNPFPRGGVVFMVRMPAPRQAFLHAPRRIDMSDVPVVPPEPIKPQPIPPELPQPGRPQDSPPPPQHPPGPPQPVSRNGR